MARNIDWEASQCYFNTMKKHHSGRYPSGPAYRIARLRANINRNERTLLALIEAGQTGTPYAKAVIEAYINEIELVRSLEQAIR